MNDDERAFRARLAKELVAWVDEGLLEPAQAERLRVRHGLGDATLQSQSRFVTSIVVLGVVLVAAGIVSFVAAHWGDIPKAAKAGLLLLAMGASHGAGFWLAEGKGSYPKLGRALVLLGTLLVGATLGLFAQMFNVTRGIEGGLLFWGLAALAMAAAMKSASHTVLAAGVGIAWWFAEREYQLIGADLGLSALGAACVALALWQRSRLGHAMAAFTFMFGLGALVVGEGHDFFLAFAGVLAALVFRGLASHALAEGALRPFRGQWEHLGTLLSVGVALVFSFKEPLRDLSRAPFHPDAWDVAVLGGLLGAAAVLHAPALRAKRAFPWVTVATVALGGALAVAWLIGPGGIVLSLVLVHGASLAFAWSEMLRGTRDHLRLPFWFGLLFAVILATCRFFEYTEGLLAKSAAFVTAGVVMLAAGVWFERRHRSLPRAEASRGAP